jgi:hypothetical protein
MKAFFLKLSSAILFISFTSMSCGEDKKDDFIERTITPVFINEEITSFFEKHLPSPALIRSNCFFFDNEDDTYYLINSMKQFRQLTYCSELPEIDFNSYSLIVGQKKVPNSFYTILEQKIVESSELELNLVLDLGENHYPAFSTLYFWGIYPKLAGKKTLNVNFVF